MNLTLWRLFNCDEAFQLVERREGRKKTAIEWVIWIPFPFREILRESIRRHGQRTYRWVDMRNDIKSLSTLATLGPVYQLALRTRWSTSQKGQLIDSWWQHSWSTHLLGQPINDLSFRFEQPRLHGDYPQLSDFID